MDTEPQPTSPRPATVPSIQTFGDVSNFLRGVIADEDSRAFSDSMGELAAHAEGVIAVLARSRRRDEAAPALMDMLTVLRVHRVFVLQLGLSWRGLYEYAGYLQSVNNLRILIGQWLQAPPWQDELEVTATDFQSATWRTLGDGMLLIDMYEQWLERDGVDSERFDDVTEPQREQVQQWWQKLRR
ncbi:hypothetical protein WG902_11205 [Ramlibacter sp. PS3R-8]|uniref:hypothetical protein n=1 Tax=Ramlibacter sp. PS3R-8 TaxID=3133437 RepID=UPI00309F0A59